MFANVNHMEEIQAVVLLIKAATLLNFYCNSANF